MSLPIAWIDALFDRLAVRYGAAWFSLWNGVDASLVKADWASELAGIVPESIKHALNHLPPDRPPTVGQFKALCLSRPDNTPKLAGPRDPLPPRVAEKLAELDAHRAAHPKAWAYALQEREQNGHKLTKAQRDMWRAALHVDDGIVSDHERIQASC